MTSHYQQPPQFSSRAAPRSAGSARPRGREEPSPSNYLVPQQQHNHRSRQMQFNGSQQHQNRNRSNRNYYRRGNSNGRWRGNGGGAREGGGPVAADDPPATLGQCELPGFVLDRHTGKYFRITSDASGTGFAPGCSVAEVARARRQREREASFAANRPRFASGSFAARPLIHPLPAVMRHRELGTCLSSRISNQLLEARLLNVNKQPSFIHDLGPADAGGGSHAGCQFLDCSTDGRTIVGCWAVGESRTSSRIMSLDVSIHHHIRQRSARLADADRPGSWVARNTLGLRFDPTSNLCDVADPTLVDMVTAPVDSDVTCVLYVTAATRISNRGALATQCRIFVQPVPELSNCECTDMLSSPIYNIYWNVDSAIWSCAWNANKMRVSLGMEECAKIIDVVSEQNFKISSRRRNVLSQDFTHDGNVIYMGLKSDDTICSDLRMKSHHVVGQLPGTRSTGWVRLLKQRPECCLTENFDGELRLWDVRKRSVPLMSFSGHHNSHYRLPCFVDSEERFLFAVGEDGCSRGWSLRTGDLLCALPSPKPVAARSDFPRAVFSPNWGGVAGNAAVVIAVGDQLRVHELSL